MNAFGGRLTPDTPGWWQGENDAEDTTAAHNGGWVGTPAYATGKVGQAFNFTGASYVQVPDSPTLAPAALTIDAWVKPNFDRGPNPPGGDGDVVFARRDAAGGYHLSLLQDPTSTTYAGAGGNTVPQGSIAFYVNVSGSQVQVIGPAVPNDGQFHHVAGTFDGTTVRVYLDGVQVASQAAAGAISHGAAANGFIGRHPTRNFNSLAAIDEVAVSSRALSAAEVQDVVARGSSGRATIWGNGASGVKIDNAPGTQVAGNVVSGNSERGVYITGAGASNTTVAGNLVGLNAAGTRAIGNAAEGVLIQGGAKDNTVGGTTEAARNVISGNQGAGVHLSGSGATGNKVYGNFLGTDKTGLAARGNTWGGVSVSDWATGNEVGGLTDLPGTGAGNVISGNAYYAVNLYSGGNLVAGNLVGLGKDGSTVVANPGGVNVSAHNVVLGGTDVRARNVISGNDTGIYSAAVGGLQILNNYVGTDRAGAAARGNTVNAYLYGPTGLVLGAPGAGNLWSGATYVSIYGFGSDWTVRGNRFGTNAAGTATVGPAQQIGIYSSTNVTVGGEGPGEGNQFADLIDFQYVTGGTVRGNLFGLTADGSAALGTGGLRLYRSGGFTIGGTTEAARNYFTTALPGVNGVTIYGFGGANNTITGNWFGVNKAGTAAVGSLAEAVSVRDSPPTTWSRTTSSRRPRMGSGSTPRSR